MLWLLWDDRRLHPGILAALVDPGNRLYTSVASIWEIAIKVRAGKLNVPPNVGEWMPGQLQQARITTLAVTLEHAAGIATLPLHHGDLFDRMLVAQALAENLTIVSTDRRLAAYGVPLLEA